ncbi:M16 family metallopeptidase [Acinetobacter sp. DSM 11652]|uniref:M16 family metallopeptidase n=1 Tax=Acinetobacter sp. DSM 11652 TaxID=346222 RepID=UPI0008C39C39|nr:pitrilysin family protein [Acinetobacter sp. DSM 11652]SEM23798.1 zinc protease [Acinetobacter sp. DSM 11652]
MNYLSSLFLTSVLCGAILSSMSHAEELIEAEPIEQIIEEDPSGLSSIKNLLSLKEIKKNSHNYQAPFVQELKNSLNVRTLFVETNDLPMVDIQITFNAGSARDEVIGKGLYGISNMAARLMLEGTDQLSAKQITTTFEGLGAKYSFNAFRDMFVVRLRVLNDPEKFDPALNLLLHLIKHATFKQSGINLALSNTHIGQKQLQENPSRLMSIQLYRMLYGDHPYAQPTAGTVGSLKKITPELLKEFRDRLLVAQNSNIAITGQLTQDQAQQISELISINLPQGQKQPNLPTPVSESGFKISVLKRESLQAHALMGHLSLERAHPDRAALEVANRMFGGGSFNSILSKELRVKRGLTYSASSTLTTPQVPGVFSFGYATQQDQLLESLKLAHQVFIDFKKQPITDSLLKENKESILRSFPMTLNSNANINAQIASIGFYGLNSNYLNEYQEQIRKLTRQDIQNAIQKHLHPDQITIIAVSDRVTAKEIEEILNQNLGLNLNKIED